VLLGLLARVAVDASSLAGRLRVLRLCFVWRCVYIPKVKPPTVLHCIFYTKQTAQYSTKEMLPNIFVLKLEYSFQELDLLGIFDCSLSFPKSMTLELLTTNNYYIAFSLNVQLKTYNANNICFI